MILSWNNHKLNIYGVSCLREQIQYVWLSTVLLSRHNYTKMRRHIESAHEGKTFKCDICQSSFTHKSNLKTHIGSVHEGKTFKCNICPSKFTEKVNLKRHIKSGHVGKTFKFHQFLQLNIA